MSESEGIQREPPAQPPPSPPDVTVPVRPLEKCPHCGSQLVADDFTWNKCGICDKRLTDPVEPKQLRTPFVATFLLGFLGALVGFAIGSVLHVEKIFESSWTMSICGGFGFATGSAIARALFKKQQ